MQETVDGRGTVHPELVLVLTIPKSQAVLREKFTTRSGVIQLDPAVLTYTAITQKKKKHIKLHFLSN